MALSMLEGLEAMVASTSMEELEAMVSATLAFGRDARTTEPVTQLDLAELLRPLDS